MLSRATSVGGTLWDRELDDDVPVALPIQILHLLRDAIGGYRAPDPWESFPQLPPSNQAWEVLGKWLAKEFGAFRHGGHPNALQNFFECFETRRTSTGCSIASSCRFA
jgi:hypothetical protein